MARHRIADEEFLYRRIPPGAHWFQPPDHVNTTNFKLDVRKNESGLSVYRKKIVNPGSVLNHEDAIPGSFLVSATAGDVRRLANGKGEPLHLNVIPVDDDHDPGHAEIRGPEQGKLRKIASKALRDLFQRL